MSRIRQVGQPLKKNCSLLRMLRHRMQARKSFIEVGCNNFVSLLTPKQTSPELESSKAIAEEPYETQAENVKVTECRATHRTATTPARSPYKPTPDRGTRSKRDTNQSSQQIEANTKKRSEIEPTWKQSLIWTYIRTTYWDSLNLNSGSV